MRILPVPGGLPLQRRDVITDLSEIEGITFDFGNTLVPVGRAQLDGVVDLTADAVVAADPRIDRGAFLSAWAEERERQFAENVPQFREVDIAERLVRVFARLRGMTAPAAGVGWDQVAAADCSDTVEIDTALGAYSDAFLAAMPPVPGVDRLLARLSASGRTLAILSNWPLAMTIDRYAERFGWSSFLSAIVVSERVGVIKPHPAIFAAAAVALGDPPPARILHVGDDWAADVAGAAAVGWRTAWISERPRDTPLPTSVPNETDSADLVLASVTDLERHLEDPAVAVDGGGHSAVPPPVPGRRR
jgi:HAD superfamily hydrolase (TIGR01509 family)